MRGNPVAELPRSEKRPEREREKTIARARGKALERKRRKEAEGVQSIGKKEDQHGIGSRGIELNYLEFTAGVATTKVIDAEIKSEREQQSYYKL